MKISIKANPYYWYILSFGTILLIYSWGWSEIYPKLSLDVVAFLIGTFVIALAVGKRIDHKLVYSRIKKSKNSNIVIIFLILGYMADFIYSGGVPLFLLFSGNTSLYVDFGIPTFHVLLLTFSNFYVVYLFHQYLCSNSRKSILWILLLVILNIFMVNRGSMIMTITSCIIVYLFSTGKILLKKISIFLIASIVFFYGFGYLGNERSFNGDQYAFLRLTNATDNFSESVIPKEYYWFYIYASSPFANFQNAVDISKKHEYNILNFVVWESLPDFLSKRIIPADEDYDKLNKMNYSINPILTVGSTYFVPYIRMGWFGPIFIFIFNMSFTYIYITIISNQNRYFVSALAILCSISIFNIFDNMINFSGLSLQLLYPIILSRLERYKLRTYVIKPPKLTFRIS